MRNYKNIILIVVLILALGFLTFSIGFYFFKRSQVSVLEEGAIISSETEQAGQQEAPITYTEDWTEVFAQARLAMDPEKCNLISDTILRRDCQDKINVLIAYRDNNINTCKAIFDIDLRDSCYINLGSDLDIDYCKYLSGAAAQKSCEENKLLGSIITQGDINRCLDLEEDSKDYCVRKVIRRFENITQCEVISDPEYKQICQENF